MKVFAGFLILLTIACVNALPKDADELDKIKEHVEVCQKETGIEEEVATKLSAGDFSQRDEKAQCFTKCFFKRTGFMNAEGVPQKEVMIAKLANKAGAHYQPLEQLIEKCIQEKGANDCETAYKIFECYWTNHADIKKSAPATA